jgi:hypothetical protein
MGACVRSGRVSSVELQTESGKKGEVSWCVERKKNGSEYEIWPTRRPARVRETGIDGAHEPERELEQADERKERKQNQIKREGH